MVCALGTMAGLAVTWFVPEIIWWVGALVGGAASGLLYALPEIVRYTPRAAKIAYQGTTAFRKSSNLIKWQTLATTMLVGLIIGYWVTLGLFERWDFNQEFGTLLLAAIAPVYLVIILWTLIGFFEHYRTEERKKQNAKKAVLLASPIGPLFLVGWLIVKAVQITPRISRVIMKNIIPGLVRFSWIFAKTLFVFVYSRELILCIASGGLGVLFSYLLCIKGLDMAFGPTLLIGGLVGGVSGILNYEIISKRALHLVSTKN